MSETTEQTPAQTPTFTWRDRTMKFKIPGTTQMMTWTRIAQEFGDIGNTPEDQPIDKERFAKALKRMGSIVFSMFAEEEDKDWLEDEILEGRVVDTDLLDLFTTIGDAIQAFADSQESDGKKGGGKSSARRVRA